MHHQSAFCVLFRCEIAAKRIQQCSVSERLDGHDNLGPGVDRGSLRNKLDQC